MTMPDGCLGILGIWVFGFIGFLGFLDLLIMFWYVEGGVIFEEIATFLIGLVLRAFDRSSPVVEAEHLRWINHRSVLEVALY